jgi:HD-GYP domain-containing protein (c-di-GMP phosphodiesterase class II)
VGSSADAPQEETSATGGSARTQAVDADARRWKSRRGITVAIRAVVLVVPFAASFLVARTLRDALPAPSGPGEIILWFATIVACSALTLAVVERFARRLLPIAALYQLALVFPDRAPARYRVVMRAGTVKHLAGRVRTGGSLGDTAAEAAENVLLLVAAIRDHDRITRGHSERVRVYADLIGEELVLDDDSRDKLRWAALVHDVGKLCVRPEVLNKPGRPTDEEWEELRAHPAEAERLVEPLRPWLGEWVDAATQHHERIDGEGYPHGLRGEEITLAGRIVAVADAYDCMTSARSYKKALPHEQARYELVRNSGTQFDARVVRALLNVSVGRLRGVTGLLGSLLGMPGVREVAPALSGGAIWTVGATMAVTAALGGAVTGPDGSAPPGGGDVASAAADASDDGSGPSPAAEASDPVADGGDPSNPAPPPDEPDSPPSGAPDHSPTTRPGRAPATSTSMPTDTTPTDRPTPTTAPSGASTTTTAPPATTTTTTTTTTPNAPPNARGDARTVLVATTTNIAVLTNDDDPDGALDLDTLTIVKPPSTGSATVVSDRIRYTAPLLALIASTDVRYEVCDTLGACAQATLRITIL